MSGRPSAARDEAMRLHLKEGYNVTAAAAAAGVAPSTLRRALRQAKIPPRPAGNPNWKRKERA